MVVSAKHGDSITAYRTIEYIIEFQDEKDMESCRICLFPADSAGRKQKKEYIVISARKKDGIVHFRAQSMKNGQKVNNIPELPAKSDFREISFNHQYSVPYDRPDRKVKILLNGYSGYTHIYIGTSKTVKGERGSGWVELSPIDMLAGRYRDFIIESNHPAGVSKSVYHGEEETGTGFSLDSRKYTWSGFTDDAVIISFPGSSSSRTPKFVFWKAANNIPLWVYSDELMFSYEFVETWSDKTPGCFEPMSDRLLLHSKVDIKEDNDARKVIVWRYGLFNPDYRTPDDSMKGFPKVEETYTIYPNTVIIRDIKYFPDLTSTHRARHELAEMIVISGSNSIPELHIGNPALTICNLDSSYVNLLPSRHFNHENISKWEEMICKINLKEHNKPFCAFAHKDYDRSYSPLKVSPEFTWHKTTYKMSHWPVSRVPYSSSDKSFSHGARVPSHTSLIGMEANEEVNWEYDYEQNDNGDIYRNYLSLAGLFQKDEFAESCVYGWIHPANVQIIHGGTYNGFNNREYTHTFSVNGDAQDHLHFTVSSGKYPTDWIALSLENTDSGTSVSKVLIDGEKTDYHVCKISKECRILIFINMKKAISHEINIHFSHET